MAEPMHRARWSKVRCWGPVSVPSATASPADLKWSVGACLSRFNSRVYSSGRCWWGSLKEEYRKPLQKKKKRKLIFINYISPCKGPRSTYGACKNLAMWNFPGVYYCPLEKSLGAVAAQPNPAAGPCCAHPWKHHVKREGSPQTKTLMSMFQQPNKSFWTGKKFDITRNKD